ncbi:MAG: GNAT family N-acetyltransferase [Myxococcales bacterium]|nr:GNAT family N-acetyltransferase [Myxococcales bacterium]MCB9701121.1 GNAT family N-acetyltransferase [Myxococcales bacterium]
MILAADDRIALVTPTPERGPALVAVNQASVEHHHPWVAPPTTDEAYAAYVERCAREDMVGMLIVRLADGAVMGAINLSQIFYGPLQSAYAGYYIGAAYAGRGHMRAALGLALDHAFGPLRLHRVEANIQPGNLASIALVRRLGFVREGFSRRYLFIEGAWRDHERFAMLAEEWAERRQVASG